MNEIMAFGRLAGFIANKIEKAGIKPFCFLVVIVNGKIVKRGLVIFKCNV
jgi:hypothetical protein